MILTELIRTDHYELSPCSAYNILDIPIKFAVKRINMAAMMENFESLGKEKFFEIIKAFRLRPIEFAVKRINKVAMMENLSKEKFLEIIKASRLPFYLDDIMGVYFAKPDLVKATCIYDISYDTADFDANNEKLHKKIIDNIVSYVNLEAMKDGWNKGEYLISICIGVSEKEFPEDQYYFEKEEEGKELLPFDEIMKRNIKAVEANNFFSINNYCDLSWSDPHILNNSHGADFKNAVNMIVDPALI